MVVAKASRQKGWRWVAVIALAAPALAGCHRASSQSVTVVPAGPVASLPYMIGPGDQLSVFVYQSPQLSVPNLAVRPDGRISLPLIPDISAAGKTPTVLAKDIEDRLKDYVKQPNVSVIVSGFVGPLDRQIRVIGEATEPLAIPYRDKMTVLDVMIQTKGLTRYAAGNSSVIVRQVGGTRQTLKVRLSDLLRDGDIDQNVAMLPGDTLIIPQSWF
jgi:polysaccharide export outer membrane protein